MRNPVPPVIDLDRRAFLKLGLSGTAVLAVAGVGGSLAGCDRRVQSAATGMRFLRDADVILFRALAPVMLKGLLPEGPAGEQPLTEIIRRIDDAGLRAGPGSQRQLQQLFDLLHLRPTRWLATGVGAPWNEADEEDITRFLRRWRGSSIGLFNAGYAVLNKLCCASYFGQPGAAVRAGYPGPLEWAYKALNN